MPAGPVPRPPRHLRDAEGAAADARGAARRPAHADAVRAGPGRARDHLDRRPEPAGEGPHRAGLGDVPGPSRGRAAAGRGTDREAAERVLAGSWPLQRRFAVPAADPSRLAAAAGRASTWTRCAASSTAAWSPATTRSGWGDDAPAAGSAGGRPSGPTGRAPAPARRPAGGLGWAADDPGPAAPADPVSCAPHARACELGSTAPSVGTRRRGDTSLAQVNREKLYERKRRKECG